MLANIPLVPPQVGVGGHGTVHSSSLFKVNLHLDDPLFIIFAYLLIYIFIYFGDSAIFCGLPHQHTHPSIT